MALNLVPIIDNETNHYVVKDYGIVKERLERYIAEECHLDLVINDDNDYKLLKNIRTDIRKQKETISQTRIQIVDLLISEFQDQLKYLESELDKADKTLKEKVDAYKPKTAKPSILTLTIKGLDIKQLEKVKTFAEKLGLIGEIK